MLVFQKKMSIFLTSLDLHNSKSYAFNEQLFLFKCLPDHQQISFQSVFSYSKRLKYSIRTRISPVVFCPVFFFLPTSGSTSSLDLQLLGRFSSESRTKFPWSFSLATNACSERSTVQKPDALFAIRSLKPFFTITI